MYEVKFAGISVGTSKFYKEASNWIKESRSHLTGELFEIFKNGTKKLIYRKPGDEFSIRSISGLQSVTKSS